MNKIKKGDIVGRKSYGKDILFVVKRILKTNKGEIVILRGLTERVEADSNLEDLELIEKNIIEDNIKKLDEKLRKRIEDKKNNRIANNKKTKEKIVPGKILHLDGDKRYSEKSYQYYKKIGLNATVKNIAENVQPRVVYRLLKTYNPDILVITGHDGMIKNGTGYNDIYNYRNSRHFIRTIQEARRYDEETKKGLVIFARSMPKLF